MHKYQLCLSLMHPTHAGEYNEAEADLEVAHKLVPKDKAIAAAQVSAKEQRLAAEKAFAAEAANLKTAKSEGSDDSEEGTGIEADGGVGLTMVGLMCELATFSGQGIRLIDGVYATETQGERTTHSGSHTLDRRGLSCLEELMCRRTFRSLRLSGCVLGKNGSQAIARGARAQNSGITTLVLEHCRIRPDGCLAIASLLSTTVSPKLTTLSLCGNGIADDGARAVATSLKANTCLTALSLRRNRITSARLQQLALAVGDHCELRELDLAENGIDFRGAAALATALEATGGEGGAPALERLLLHDNRLESDSVWRLASATYDHQTLESVGLRGLRGAPILESDMRRLRGLCEERRKGSVGYDVDAEWLGLGPSPPEADSAMAEDDEVWLGRLGHSGLFC